MFDTHADLSLCEPDPPLHIIEPVSSKRLKLARTPIEDSDPHSLTRVFDGRSMGKDIYIWV